MYSVYYAMKMATSQLRNLFNSDQGVCVISILTDIYELQFHLSTFQWVVKPSEGLPANAITVGGMRSSIVEPIEIRSMTILVPPGSFVRLSAAPSIVWILGGKQLVTMKEWKEVQVIMVVFTESTTNGLNRVLIWRQELCMRWRSVVKFQWRSLDQRSLFPWPRTVILVLNLPFDLSLASQLSTRWATKLFKVLNAFEPTLLLTLHFKTSQPKS